MTPTPEQAAIIEAARTTKDNIIINALAGAAKTSTLEMIAKAVTGIPIMSLAFNKRIAEEMTRRLPSHCKCMTLNGVGHRAWAQGQGRNMTLNTDKLYDLLKEEINDLDQSDRGVMMELFGDTLSCLKKSKALGWMPRKAYSNVLHLYNDDTEFFDNLEISEGIDLEPLQRDLIKVCIERSIKQSFDGVIDFDDQIYMPTLFGGAFPKFHLTLCDEVQDFSVLNQRMVQRMVEGRRIIAVGDPYQSIYAFRGADSGAMDSLKRMFHMKEFNLSISFRCPKKIVELARRRAPHMQYPEWAKPGSIEHWNEWRIKDIPDNSFVLCRNNAPLFYLALQFLKKGRGVNLVGSQLTKSLLRTMKKLGNETMSQEQTIHELDKWLATNIKKARTEAKLAILQEKYDCILVFVKAGKTLSQMISFAETVFNSKGNVSLMTGHKSKGLENDTVFHLDPHLVAAKWREGAERPAWVEQQELNLQYVMDTRTKDKYIYIDTEQLED